MADDRTSRRRRRSLLTALGLAAGLLVGTAAGAGAAPAQPASAEAAPGATWQVTDRLAFSAARTAAACASATDCWAVAGGKLLHSADVGGLWADRTAALPADLRGVSDVVCPSSSRCVLAGFTGAGAVLLLVDGTTVASRPISGAPGAPLSLACSSERDCLATDGVSAFRTDDAGSTWATSTLPRTMPDGSAVSCVPGGSTCVVAGTRGGFTPVPVAARSRDGGATWQALTIPSGHRTNARFDDVVCVSAALCRMVGDSGADTLMVTTTSATGVDTAVVALPVSLWEIHSLACTSATVCTGYAEGAAHGEQRDLTTTDGRHWRSAVVDPRYAFDPYAVACAPGGRCVAVTVGTARTRTADGTWVSVTIPAALRGVVDLSCADVLPCVGVGSDAAGRAVAVRGRPGSWSISRMAASITAVDAVDCASTSVCTALTQYRIPGDPAPYRRAYRTTDGGATWKAQTLPSPVSGSTLALDCPTDSSCLALGFTSDYQPDLLRTSDSGTTWTRVTAPHGAVDARSAACVGASSCVVAGRPEFGTPPVTWRTTDLGTTFGPAVRVGLSNSDVVSDLACRGVVCVASGYLDRDAAIARSTDGARHWSVSPAPVDRLSATTGLACGPDGRCALLAAAAAQAYRPLVSTDLGATWHLGAFPPGHGSLGPIACVDTGCFAFGTDRADLPVVLVDPA